MESRDGRKPVAHMSQKLREPRNADNPLLSGPVEPIQMLFVSNASGWERISSENTGRADYSSKGLRQSYGADEPNAMLKYACRNRAHERQQQGSSNDKHAVPGGDLMHREVPGIRATRGEAPAPLVGSPDMPMPGIPVAEVRESVMIKRPPSGPSTVEKKPSVTNLHGSSPNWTRLSAEASCSRKHGGRSHHRDFAVGAKHESSHHTVERTSSSDLHSSSSVFQTVSKALESQKRNKHNHDSPSTRKYFNYEHRFAEPVATSVYSSAHVGNRQDVKRERTNKFLNTSMFNSWSSFHEMFKDPDVCELSHLNLHAKSSMMRAAQNAQRALDQSVSRFDELIEVVSNTMTELYNISTSDSYDSCVSKLPNRHDYHRRYRQVREVTSNLNCYVTTDPSMSPVSVSAFTTTTVTNIGESRRSNHSVGDSFLNDYSKKLNTPCVGGRYNFSADESGDRNTQNNVCIKCSSTKNYHDKDFPGQEEEKLDNTCKNEENNIPKNLNSEPRVKCQEVNSNEKDNTLAPDNITKEFSGNDGTVGTDMNTLEKDPDKEQSCDIKEAQEPVKCADVTEINKSPAKVSEVLDTNVSVETENITKSQGCDKPAAKEDNVENNSGGSGKSTNRRLEKHVTELSDHKFHIAVSPVEIAQSIISDYSKSISSSINVNPTCQQRVARKLRKNEQKLREDQKLVSLENNDLSHNRSNVNPKTTKSSETEDFSDSTLNTPRNVELQFRPWASFTLDEKKQDTMNSVPNGGTQESTATEKEAEKRSELSATETKQTKVQDVAEVGGVTSEQSENVNIKEETNKCENEKLKGCAGTHVLQSLDRKVLDVMELVKSQLQKERPRHSSQLENANGRKKNHKNALVRNEPVRFSKDERLTSRHTFFNKHLDSRSHKNFHCGNSSRHGDDLEAVLRTRHCVTPEDGKVPDASTDSNREKESCTNLRQVAAIRAAPEDSDKAKRREADRRRVLDTLVDNVTGMIKLKKFQMSLVDTLKSTEEPQRCKRKVTRAFNPANLRLQRKTASPRSAPELDKEHNSPIGLCPTTARCSLMCQDNRVECISHDLKKRGEEIKKCVRPAEAGKEFNLKAKKIGISNNVTAAAKSDYKKEPKTAIRDHSKEIKCEKGDCKDSDKQRSKHKNVESDDITTPVDDMESGSEKITPVGSSSNVYDIKINITNRATSNINVKGEGVVNNFASREETSQKQLPNRGNECKVDQQKYTESTVKTRLNENRQSKDSYVRKENSLNCQTDHSKCLHVIDNSRDNPAENVKSPVSNDDARLSNSHSENNHFCPGEKQKSKSKKYFSDSFVKYRNACLKRNIRIKKCASPTGDGDVVSKAPCSSLKMKEQKRNKIKSSAHPKDGTDRNSKLSFRFTKHSNLERTGAKTKPAQVSGTNSHSVQKPTKATEIKATTSSDQNEPNHNEGDDGKMKVFEGYGCGTYVKVDGELSPREEKANIESGAISKVHIKTNSSNQLSSKDKPLHQFHHCNLNKMKSKQFLGYGSAVLIKPDGKVTEINLRKHFCALIRCNDSKRKSLDAAGESLQLEKSQIASSSNCKPGVSMNENANKVTRLTKESTKDVISSKCSAVKLFLEKPSVEEKIISQVSCSENVLLGASKRHARAIDFILNGIKFSDSKKIVPHKSSINNSICDTEGLWFFNPEESNLLFDRNKIMPNIYRRASSRGFSFSKERTVFEKRLATLIEIIESLISDDKHEDTCQSETETRDTTHDVESTEVGNVDYTKHINEERGFENKLENVGNEEESTLVPKTNGDCLNSEIVPQMEPTENNLILSGTDASETIDVKRECLVLEENKLLESENGDIITKEFPTVTKSKDLSAGDGTISETDTEDRIESNIEIAHDVSKSQNTADENKSNRVLIHRDIYMPVIKNESSELERSNEYGDGISTEYTDSDLPNVSKCSSCSSLFSSCDSLTTSDYVEIFRGYIDGDNSTEREVDLYDDSTASSVEIKSNFFGEQQLEDWRNIYRNRQNYHSSETSYNVNAGRVTLSNFRALYPSDSEVSTYLPRTSTQSSNISSFKKIRRTENKSLNSIDLRQEGCKLYSVEEQMDSENDEENYWTLNDLIREPSTERSSNPVGMRMETISEVSSSDLDEEIFPSLNSIISKCVEDTLNGILRDFPKTLDSETYGHILSQQVRTYDDSEQSSCQELTVTETRGCETTDSDSNFNNSFGNVMRTTRVSINRFSEDTNEYPSSCTNSHGERLSTGYNEMLNCSSSNSEEVLESCHCGTSYSTVRKSITAWQRESLKSAEEGASSRGRTSLSESSTLDEGSESAQEEAAVLELTSPETMARVLDAIAHSEGRRPVHEEAEEAAAEEVGVFEFRDPLEFLFDGDVIHASSDFVLPCPTEDCEDQRSEGSSSLSQLAAQFSAAALRRRRTSSAWLEGALRRLESSELSRRRRTREDRGGGALAISICICLIVFVYNRSSFTYGDAEY